MTKKNTLELPREKYKKPELLRLGKLKNNIAGGKDFGLQEEVEGGQPHGPS